MEALKKKINFLFFWGGGMVLLIFIYCVWAKSCLSSAIRTYIPFFICRK